MTHPGVAGVGHVAEAQTPRDFISIDTVVVGGPATVADFSYALIFSFDGAMFASDATDPSAAACTQGAT